MTYAAVSDVAAELGRPASSSTEQQQWQAWLNRVERNIIRGFKRAGLVLATEISEGNVDVADVKDVEVAAVLRKIANPDGLTSITRSVDDASVTVRRDGVDDTDPLAVTDDEWDLLMPDLRGGAFTIRPVSSPGFADEAWW